MGKVRCLYLLVISFSLVYSSAFAADNVTVDFIAAGIEHNASLIRDITVDFQKIASWKDPNDDARVQEKFKGKWIKKGDMEYLEWTNASLGSEGVIYVYRNGKTMMWFKDFNNPEFPGAGKIIGEEDGVFDNEYPPAKLSFEFDFFEWWKIFINGTAKLVGTENIDRHLCHIVSGKFLPNGKWEYKVWIDIERGFQPLAGLEGERQLFKPRGEIADVTTNTPNIRMP